MQPELIPHFVERRVRELGYSKFVLDYEQVQIAGGQTASLSAYNNLYVLCDSPKTVRIRSELGAYGYGRRNIHEHRGTVEIENTGTEDCWVSFVKVIIQQ